MCVVQKLELEIAVRASIAWCCCCFRDARRHPEMSVSRNKVYKTVNGIGAEHLNNYYRMLLYTTYFLYMHIICDWHTRTHTHPQHSVYSHKYHLFVYEYVRMCVIRFYQTKQQALDFCITSASTQHTIMCTTFSRSTKYLRYNIVCC